MNECLRLKGIGGRPVIWLLGFIFGLAGLPVIHAAQALKMVAGSGHTCALMDDETVVCWGRNSRGQVGNGTRNYGSQLAPVMVDGISGIIAIAAGGAHTCALKRNGTVACWGHNGFGQLGDGTSSDDPHPEPTMVRGLSGVVAIGAGNVHTCALKQSGAVVCWGYNDYGALGSGDWLSSSLPVPVKGLFDVSSISVRQDRVCALKKDGTVACWGEHMGPGQSNGVGSDINAPRTINGFFDISELAVADGHVCGLKIDGSVSCWGGNSLGQLGRNTGDVYFSDEPAAVDGLSDAVSLSSGFFHTCALRANGLVSCWGSNQDGQLGNGERDSGKHYVPSVVNGLSGVVSMAAGSTYMCALMATGEAACWGENYNGQLGNRLAIQNIAPVMVNGVFMAVGVAIGYGHSCILIADGTVKCWGENSEGQLGDGSRIARSTPITASGLAGVRAIAAGDGYTCAMREDGTVVCWGRNTNGQLGDGKVEDRLVPDVVAGLSGVTAISARYRHTCALKIDGTVACWGRNRKGSLGDGTTVDSRTPVPVSGLSDVVAISAGYMHTCAVRRDGAMVCWGSNESGQLGNGEYDTADHPEPIMVSGLSGVASAVAGLTHSCAVKADGTMACWGLNDYGQLGIGSIDYLHLTPTVVSDFQGGVAAGVGGYHSCAIRNDGSVACWGINDSGQLGTGSREYSSVPAAVLGLSDAVAIAVGGYTCAVRASGGVACWGSYNSAGSIGNGALDHYETPQRVLWEAPFSRIGPYTSTEAFRVIPCDIDLQTVACHRFRGPMLGDPRNARFLNESSLEGEDVQ